MSEQNETSQTIGWTWADPNQRTWSREQLLEFIDAAMGIICNAHAGTIDEITTEHGAAPGWAEAARRWVDAYPALPRRSFCERCDQPIEGHRRDGALLWIHAPDAAHSPCPRACPPDPLDTAR